MANPSTFKDYFDDYVKSVWQIEIDVRFWKSFLTMSIEKYKKENPENRWISQSGFSLYNIPADGKHIWLHSSNETSSIEIVDLTMHSDNFFVWIMNLALVRLYNAVELLLLRSIKQEYFPTLSDPIIGKNETNKVIAHIKTYLRDNGHVVDIKNNRYLILFLMCESPQINSFYNLEVNSVNWKTNWINFYEFFSILRNIITHHAMLVSQNVRNEIKSLAGDIFLHYFEQPDDNKKIEVLKVKDEQYFLNFINHINDLAANSMKFIAGEQDFKFIGLYKA